MSFNPLAFIGWALGVTVVGSRRLADLEGRADAADKSQAVAEYNMDGTVRTANEHFLTRAVGYALRDLRKHHNLFVGEAHRDSPDYRNFWSKLRRGELDAGEYKRVARDGREIWMREIYVPVCGPLGQPFKVVEYATDITAVMLRRADSLGQISAINRVQAVITFELDGTVRTANDNFLRTMGYSLEEIQAKREHVCHAGRAQQPEISRLVATARSWRIRCRAVRAARPGRPQAVAAGQLQSDSGCGRQAIARRQICDGHNRSGQTAQQLRIAVEETKTAVSAAAQGDLTRRINVANKSGEVAALSNGVNSLIDESGSLIHPDSHHRRRSSDGAAGNVPRQLQPVATYLRAGSKPGGNRFLHGGNGHHGAADR